MLAAAMNPHPCRHQLLLEHELGMARSDAGEGEDGDRNGSLLASRSPYADKSTLPRAWSHPGQESKRLAGRLRRETPNCASVCLLMSTRNCSQCSGSSAVFQAIAARYIQIGPRIEARSNQKRAYAAKHQVVTTVTVRLPLLSSSRLSFIRNS
jgi:hypothetical protein